MEKRVAGEWFEVKERLHRPEALYGYFREIEKNERRRERQVSVFGEAAAALESAVEGGVFEVRRRLITDILGELAEAEYSSEVFGRLHELSCEASALVVVTALEHALLRGDLAFEEGTGEAEPSGSTEKTEAENAQIKDIIADIREIVASDPSAKMNQAIKNILLQARKYRDEAATFKKLREQASDYRLEMYTKTFSATFQQIFDSIRRNYGSYLEEREEELRRERGDEASPLAGLETRPWVRATAEALEDASRLRATVAFASEEHSGMRSVLVALARERDRLLEQIESEREIAEGVCRDASGGDSVEGTADDGSDGGRSDGSEDGNNTGGAENSGAGRSRDGSAQAKKLARLMSLEIAARLKRWIET